MFGKQKERHLIGDAIQKVIDKDEPTIRLLSARLERLLNSESTAIHWDQYPLSLRHFRDAFEWDEEYAVDFHFHYEQTHSVREFVEDLDTAKDIVRDGRIVYCEGYVPESWDEPQSEERTLSILVSNLRIKSLDNVLTEYLQK